MSLRRLLYSDKIPDKLLIVVSEGFSAAWKLMFVWGVFECVREHDYASACAGFMLFLIFMDMRKEK